MPLRDKFRRAFRRPSSSSTSSPPSPPLPHTTPRSSKKPSKQPPPPADHPPPKYRGPVNPAHAASLRAFSFGAAAAGRRRSGQSQYSPRGSRVGSVGRGSLEAAGAREAEADGGDAEGDAGDAEGDGGDVGNVGLSRQHTAASTTRLGGEAAGPDGAAEGAGRAGANGGGKLFSEEELARAMMRCEVRV